MLAYSGLTGFTGKPHLHFHVGVRLLGNPGRTIPVRFKDSTGHPVNFDEGATLEPAKMGESQRLR